MRAALGGDVGRAARRKHFFLRVGSLMNLPLALLFWVVSSALKCRPPLAIMYERDTLPFQGKFWENAPLYFRKNAKPSMEPKQAQHFAVVSVLISIFSPSSKLPSRSARSVFLK